MVFSSFVFIFAFLPITLAGYFLLARLKNPSIQKYFLILASLVFYVYYDLFYLPIILASILCNFAAALMMQRCSGSFRRLFFILGIAFNILLLGYYKYSGFFIENLSLLCGMELAVKNVLLPLGISFFTFQQLSYLLCIWRGELQAHSFRDYCLFVCFFPKLVMGPLAEPSELIPQFQDTSRRSFNSENFASGLFIFSMGLFKKAFLADTIALLVDNGFALASPGLAAAWVTSLSYTLQIYFDFSGYSDMALGLARMLNFELPFNFLSPYRSESVSQFWRRWHITLGRALSSYIYRPLGGNRKGLLRTCLNLFLTFMVSGLWHGAAWTFVLWGALHGLIIALERVFAKALDKIPHFIRVSCTFLCVNFLWVLFRAESFRQAMGIYRGMFSFNNIAFSQLAAIAYDGNINFPNIVDYTYIALLLFAGLFLVFFCKNSAEKLKSFRFSLPQLLLTVLMFCLSMLCMTRESIFIYFNF